DRTTARDQMIVRGRHHSPHGRVVGVVTLLMAVEAEQVFLRSAVVGIHSGAQSLIGGRIVDALPEIDCDRPAVDSIRLQRAERRGDVVRRMTRSTGYGLESLLRNRAGIDDSIVEACTRGSLKRRMTLCAKTVLGRGMIGLRVPRGEPSAARQLPGLSRIIPDYAKYARSVVEAKYKMAPGTRLGRRIIVSRDRHVGGERRIKYPGRDRRGRGRGRWRFRALDRPPSARPSRRREQQHYQQCTRHQPTHSATQSAVGSLRTTNISVVGSSGLLIPRLARAGQAVSFAAARRSAIGDQMRNPPWVPRLPGQGPAAAP